MSDGRGLSCDTRSGGQCQNRGRAEVADHPRSSRSRNQDQAGRDRRGVRCEQAADQGDPANPQSSGLVTLVASTGAWVSTLDLDECREIYLMRERLEPLLLRMAMPSHTAESFVEFEASALRVEAATSPGEFLECDHDFHQALMAGATTIRLHDTVDHLWNLTHYYRRQLLAPNAVTRRSRRAGHLRRAPHDPSGRHRRRCRIRRGDVGVAYSPHQKARRTLPRDLYSQRCGWTREVVLSSNQP